MKFIALIFFPILHVFAFGQELPSVAIGKIERLENFHSEFVTAGNMDIRLPENYTTENKYRVIYMHDGQNLFDSTKTRNK